MLILIALSSGQQVPWVFYYFLEFRLPITNMQSGYGCEHTWCPLLRVLQCAPGKLTYLHCPALYSAFHGVGFLKKSRNGSRINLRQKLPCVPTQAPSFLGQMRLPRLTAPNEVRSLSGPQSLQGVFPMTGCFSCPDVADACLPLGTL